MGPLLCENFREITPHPTFKIPIKSAPLLFDFPVRSVPRAMYIREEWAQNQAEQPSIIILLAFRRARGMERKNDGTTRYA